MRHAQPLGQRMDQARARFRRAVEAGEKAQDAVQKAQAKFEEAQQEVVQAQKDEQAHAGSPVASDASSTSQCEPGQNLGSLNRAYRKHVESRGSTTTRPTDSCNPGVEGNPSDLIDDLVSGGRSSGS